MFFLMVSDIQSSIVFTFHTKIDLKQNQFTICKKKFYKGKIENNSIHFNLLDKKNVNKNLKQS